MPKKKTKVTEIVYVEKVNPVEEVAIPVVTYKQELENLHREMSKHGIHSIGQLEVKISQQK